MRGPAVLFAAWAIHDAEAALTFPATAGRGSTDMRSPVSGLTSSPTCCLLWCCADTRRE